MARREESGGRRVLFCNHAKTGVFALFGGVEGESRGGAAVGGAAHIVAAAGNALGAVGRAFGIGDIIAGVGVVVVGAPFAHAAEHVEELPGVGCLSRNGPEMAAAVGVVPRGRCELGQRQRLGRSSATGVFPLGLGGQT